MAGTLKTIAGPAYIADSATNIYSPPNSAVYTVLKHIHICNVTAAAKTFSLYIGATGASTGGTEIFKDYSVPANSTLDFYCNIKMTSADFLVGVASAASGLTIHVSGEYVAT